MRTLPIAILSSLLVSSATRADDTRAAIYQHTLNFPDHLAVRYVEPIWLSDGSRFYFVRHAGGLRRFVLIDPATGIETDCLDQGKLSAALEQVTDGRCGHREESGSADRKGGTQCARLSPGAPITVHAPE